MSRVGASRPGWFGPWREWAAALAGPRKRGGVRAVERDRAGLALGLRLGNLVGFGSLGWVELVGFLGLGLGFPSLFLVFSLLFFTKHTQK